MIDEYVTFGFLRIGRDVLAAEGYAPFDSFEPACPFDVFPFALKRGKLFALR